jgi:peptidoglycan/LPS O-acetylase OafA/YrhL
LVTGNDAVMPFHIFFGIAFLMLGVALSKFRFKLIVNPIMQYIGKISFSMYLFHFSVIHWLTNLHFIEYSTNGLLNYVARFSLVTCLTVLISSFLYRAIEIPFQKIGKKIIDKLELKNST